MAWTEEERISRFSCVGCGVDTSFTGIDEYYMVHDALWLQAAGANHDEMLCIGCLEKRIGRELTPADFTDCSLNKDLSWHKSDRLLNRLGLSSANH